ncbi:hypothetical protein L1887_18354 [Cichorium endivia]|nr:hypothetical protein L1887_18354 [Cichorium endivia]
MTCCRDLCFCNYFIKKGAGPVILSSSKTLQSLRPPVTPPTHEENQERLEELRFDEHLSCRIFRDSGLDISECMWSLIKVTSIFRSLGSMDSWRWEEEEDDEEEVEAIVTDGGGT